jgi:hypothetical protein
MRQHQMNNRDQSQAYPHLLLTTASSNLSTEQEAGELNAQNEREQVAIKHPPALGPKVAKQRRCMNLGILLVQPKCFQRWDNGKIPSMA